MSRYPTHLQPSGCFCWQCIPASTVGIVENMGEFVDVLPPGCHILNCLTGEVKGLVNLKVDISRIIVNCPTKDRSTVTVTTNIMHKVIPSYVHTAFYSLGEGVTQVEQFVQNALRSAIPNYTVDELFLSRFELAEHVKADLVPFLSRFGKEVVDVLVADIEPRADIKQMFSNQMTMRYARIANGYKADANKIELVKAAEAEAECARLSGLGMAEQRKVITSGLTLNLHAWQEAESKGKHVPESEVLATMMMLQYFDLMNSIVDGGKVKPAVCFMQDTCNKGAGAASGGGGKTSRPAGGLNGRLMATSSSSVRQRKPIHDDDI